VKDRSAIFIATSDLLLCVLSVVIVAVAPEARAKKDNPEQKAEFMITVDWPVDRDDDVDAWLAKEGNKPLFYASRDVGCGTLDRDSRGYMDGRVTLADGSVVSVSSYKETITLRCNDPGHYVFAVNFYGSHEGKPPQPIKVHAEILQLNPQVATVFAQDVTLNQVGQTINLTGFDLTKDGHLTLTDAPLAPVTATWLRSSPGGYP
jgi:hypothetical protein